MAAAAAADASGGDDTAPVRGTARPPVPASPGVCYACHKPFRGGGDAADAPCRRPEHATHAGRCYAYTHCAATLDGEAPCCGACGVASDTVRGSFLAYLPGIAPGDDGGGGGEPRFDLVGWSEGSPSMAAVQELLLQAPPPVELPARGSLPIVAPAAATPPPATALGFVDRALGRATVGRGGGGGDAAAAAEETARGDAMRRLEADAARWAAEAFWDPRAALVSRGVPLGEGVLRAEILVAARITLDDLARTGRLSGADAATHITLAAPTWGDLRALGLTSRHLAAHRAGALAPAVLARTYGINGALLCDQGIVEGVAGLARLGYTAPELRVLGVSAPWLLAGAAGANNSLARLAQFVAHGGGASARPLPLADWAAYLELTPALLAATTDYSEARLYDIWETPDITQFLARARAVASAAAAGVRPPPLLMRPGGGGGITAPVLGPGCGVRTQASRPSYGGGTAML